MPKPQAFANHVKFDPPFHFFVLPVLLANVIAMGRFYFHAPSLGAAWLVVVSVALLLLAARTRSFVTHLQDRIIRLEERLRLSAVLQEPLRSRTAELTDSQLIGLRFASDAELPRLVQRALDEKLSRKDIKKAVVNWKPDYSRV